MLQFKADDGYSYLIEVISERLPRTYRIDSEATHFQLATNETVFIKRLDISPEVSIKLSNIRKRVN